MAGGSAVALAVTVAILAHDRAETGQGVPTDPGQNDLAGDLPRAGTGQLERTTPLVFSYDETTDVGMRMILPWVWPVASARCAAAASASG
jgi:hypothetical protein